MSLFQWFCLLYGLGLLLVIVLPLPPEYRDVVARERAQLATAADGTRLARQAWRRRVFGSHPVLYWGLAWTGAPVLLCVVAVLMGW